jgi:hypothetical protein
MFLKLFWWAGVKNKYFKIKKNIILIHFQKKNTLKNNHFILVILVVLDHHNFSRSFSLSVLTANLKLWKIYRLFSGGESKGGCVLQATFL